MDVLRRVWARSHFEPGGGWPGRQDEVLYDMWEHTDKPPAGRDYGLRTYKVGCSLCALTHFLHSPFRTRFRRS